MALIPAEELTVMMEPPLPASIIAGTTALMVFHTPVRLTSMTSRHWSASISQSRAQLAIPALATTMSRRPNRVIASWITFCCPARSRTSTRSAMMSRPRSLTAEMVSSNSCDVVAG
ncbi:Uncharacterised protein [Mycobacteroides abscessus subsp. abscessus]|nr:Uncharacterised protein [Mycobacteroides abscessus subsp. abscessus]